MRRIPSSFRLPGLCFNLGFDLCLNFVFHIERFTEYVVYHIGNKIFLHFFVLPRNYMNDSLRTDVFLRFSAETVACACIYLSARSLQVSITCTTESHGSLEHTLLRIQLTVTYSCTHHAHQYSHIRSHQIQDLQW